MRKNNNMSMDLSYLDDLVSKPEYPKEMKEVLDKKKPSALIHSFNIHKDLKTTQMIYSFSSGTRLNGDYAISGKNNKVYHVISNEIIKIIENSKAFSKAKNLLENINDQVIADAHKYINKHTIRLGNFNSHKPQAEIALIEGILFGYQPCCVKEYVNIEYFNKKPHEYYNNNSANNKLCLPCSKKILTKILYKS